MVCGNYGVLPGGAVSRLTSSCVHIWSSCVVGAERSVPFSHFSHPAAVTATMWASNTCSSFDLDGEELCLIDARIASMASVNLRPQLKSLNLHCNLLTRVENLLHLRNLQHLDLSSNQIARMEGFDALVSLRTLNLACNLIETVKGLGNLRWGLHSLFVSV